MRRFELSVKLLTIGRTRIVLSSLFRSVSATNLLIVPVCEPIHFFNLTP